MAHTHTLADGQRTGPDILDPNDSKRHWHEVDGDRTTSDAHGPGHVHLFYYKLANPLGNEIPVDDGSNQVAGAHEEDDNLIQNNALHDSSKGVAMESKSFGGKATEIKEEIVNGVPVGIIRGYIATWDLDRGMDRFVRGAFSESLTELRAKNRPIRFKDHHDRTVGGFPIQKVFEDEKGLFGQGEINLDVQQGREAFALAKQGVLSDFSIGFTAVESEMDGDIRKITKAIVWEGSIVDEPMNTAAVITEVKSTAFFQDLPLADRNQPWDSAAAMMRVLIWSGVYGRDGIKGEPNDVYQKAFAWVNLADLKSFEAYKLQIVDIIDHKMVVVPHGIFAAAAALSGADGDIGIPEADRPKAIGHLERYYAKMGLESPFPDKVFFTSEDVKDWTARDFEQFLKASEQLSKSAVKILSARVDKKNEPDYSGSKRSEDWRSVLAEINRVRL